MSCGCTTWLVWRRAHTHGTPRAKVVHRGPQLTIRAARALDVADRALAGCYYFWCIIYVEPLCVKVMVATNKKQATNTPPSGISISLGLGGVPVEHGWQTGACCGRGYGARVLRSSQAVHLHHTWKQPNDEPLSLSVQAWFVIPAVFFCGS